MQIWEGVKIGFDEKINYALRWFVRPGPQVFAALFLWQARPPDQKQRLYPPARWVDVRQTHTIKVTLPGERCETEKAETTTA